MKLKEPVTGERSQRNLQRGRGVEACNGGTGLEKLRVGRRSIGCWPRVSWQGSKAVLFRQVSV